jgi:hypothetical protein
LVGQESRFFLDFFFIGAGCGTKKAKRHPIEAGQLVKSPAL